MTTVQTLPVSVWRGENTHPGALNFYPIFIPLYEAKVSGVPPEADSGYAILPTFPDTSYETSFPKLELVQSRGTLHFVGWVEPAPDFVGFRCT